MNDVARVDDEREARAVGRERGELRDRGSRVVVRRPCGEVDDLERAAVVAAVVLEHDASRRRSRGAGSRPARSSAWSRRRPQHPAGVAASSATNPSCDRGRDAQARRDASARGPRRSSRIGAVVVQEPPPRRRRRRGSRSRARPACASRSAAVETSVCCERRREQRRPVLVVDRDVPFGQADERRGRSARRRGRRAGRRSTAAKCPTPTSCSAARNSGATIVIRSAGGATVAGVVRRRSASTPGVAVAPCVVSAITAHAIKPTPTAPTQIHAARGARLASRFESRFAVAGFEVDGFEVDGFEVDRLEIAPKLAPRHAPEPTSAGRRDCRGGQAPRRSRKRRRCSRTAPRRRPRSRRRSRGRRPSSRSYSSSFSMDSVVRRFDELVRAGEVEQLAGVARAGEIDDVDVVDGVAAFELVALVAGVHEARHHDVER